MTSIFANVVWPALNFEERLFALSPIAAGLIVELFFLRWVTSLGWAKCAAADLAMNTASALAGLPLIPISGIGWEFGVEVVRHYGLGRVDHLGSFHPSNWAAAFVLAVLINATLEAAVVRYAFQQRPWRRLFAWLCLANTVTVGVAVLSLWIHPPRT